MTDGEIELYGNRKYSRQKLMAAAILLDHQERQQYEQSDEYIAYARQRAHGVPHCLVNLEVKVAAKLNKAH